MVIAHKAQSLYIILHFPGIVHQLNRGLSAGPIIITELPYHEPNERLGPNKLSISSYT